MNVLIDQGVIASLHRNKKHELYNYIRYLTCTLYHDSFNIASIMSLILETVTYATEGFVSAAVPACVVFMNVALIIEYVPLHKPFHLYNYTISQFLETDSESLQMDRVNRYCVIMLISTFSLPRYTIGVVEQANKL